MCKKKVIEQQFHIYHSQMLNKAQCALEAAYVRVCVAVLCSQVITCSISAVEDFCLLTRPFSKLLMNISGEYQKQALA